MEECLKQEIIKEVEENNLEVACSYTISNNIVYRKYYFTNYSDSCQYDEYFKKVCEENHLSLSNLAEMIYSALSIKCSQDHEFFI
jgi:hypothetical protein